MKPAKRYAPAIIALVILLGILALKIAQDNALFMVGEDIGDSWIVEETTQHEEFLRVRFSQNSLQTGLEIKYHNGAPGEWCTRFYRVQPAPGENPPSRLLELATNKLRKAEDENTDAVVQKKSKQWKNKMHYFLLGFVYFLLIAFLILTAFYYQKSFPEKRAPALYSIAFSIFCATSLFTLFQFSELPSALVNLLQQGSDETLLKSFYNEGVHSGGAWQFFSSLLPLNQTSPLKNAIATNIILWTLTSNMLFIVANHIFKNTWTALILSLFLAFNPISIASMLSELPGTTLSFLFFTGCIAIFVFRNPQAFDWLKWPAAIILLLVMAIAVQTRPETALVAASVLFGLAFNRFPIPTLCKKTRFFSEAKNVIIIIFSVAIAVTTIIVVHQSKSPNILPQELSWDAHGFLQQFIPEDSFILVWTLFDLNPLDANFLLAPYYLWHFFSIGFISICSIGFLYSLLHIKRFVFFPLGLILLLNVYGTAFNGHFSYYFRFSSVFIAPVMFMALWGWSLISETISDGTKQYPQMTVKALEIILLMLCLFPFVKQPGDWAKHDNAGTESYGYTMSFNQQLEMRALLDLADKYPECIMLTKVLKTKVDHEAEYSYIFWGHMIQQLYEKKHIDDLVLERKQLNDAIILASEFMENHCVAVVKTADCYRENMNSCPDILEDLKSLERICFPSQPYAPQEEWGDMESPWCVEMLTKSHRKKTTD